MLKTLFPRRRDAAAMVRVLRRRNLHKNGSTVEGLKNSTLENLAPELNLEFHCYGGLLREVGRRNRDQVCRRSVQEAV